MNVTIKRWSHSRNAIEITFLVGDRPVMRTCTYDSVDLDSLDPVRLDQVCAQLAMMETIPFTGLAPKTIDLGPASRWFTPKFEALWRAVWRGTSAQWRYENDRQDYEPVIERSGVVQASRPASVPPPGGRPGGLHYTEPLALAFCGGGKDSLAAITLLRRAGIPFTTFSYAHADYGDADHQHGLIDGLLDAAGVDRRHRMNAEDGLESREGLICAETPISLFYALPLMLHHGYRYLVVGNEASADAPNLIWNGEAVNHQWGKSAEAERLLNDYLRSELIADASWFSIIKPLHDGVIVSLLRDEPAVTQTHSCNVAKPWCGACPKCAYVWLQMAAFLPEPPPFAITEQWLPRLLGLEGDKPFECVGEPGESRLAFELCRGRYDMPDYGPFDIDERYFEVGDASNIPAEIRERVLPVMRAAANDARQRVWSAAAKAAAFQSATDD